jgi:hypothetical protein
MVTISITADASAAIEATLPKGSKAEARRDGKGGLPNVGTAADQEAVERACIEWRNCPPGKGNDEFFRLGLKLTAAGCDEPEIKRILHEEAHHACSPDERFRQIPSEFLRKLRQEMVAADWRQEDIFEYIEACERYIATGDPYIDMEPRQLHCLEQDPSPPVSANLPKLPISFLGYSPGQFLNCCGGTKARVPFPLL